MTSDIDICHRVSLSSDSLQIGCDNFLAQFALRAYDSLQRRAGLIRRSLCLTLALWRLDGRSNTILSVNKTPLILPPPTT